RHRVRLGERSLGLASERLRVGSWPLGRSRARLSRVGARTMGARSPRLVLHRRTLALKLLNIATRTSRPTIPIPCASARGGDFDIPGTEPSGDFALENNFLHC